MKSRTDLYFQTSVNLLLAVGFFALASTGKVDIPSILCFVCGYAAYFYLNYTERLPLLSPERVSFFSKVYILVFALDMWWLSGAFVNAAIHLLIFIQLLKFFSKKKDRDYFYLILISFMELLVAAAITVSAVFFFSFLMFLVLVISTLISFEMKRSQESPGETRLQKLGRHGAPIRPSANEVRHLYGALGATSALLGVGIVVAAALFFFALPRVQGGFFSGLNSPTQPITGFSSTVRFGEIGSIKNNMTVVMRVQGAGEPRELEGVKWRGIALNVFDGNAWHRGLKGKEVYLGRDASGNYQVPPALVPAPHHLIRYQILLEAISTEVLFAAARARLIESKTRLRMSGADSLATDYHPYSRIRYEVISDVAAPPATSLREAGSDYPPDVEENYLAVPRMDPRISRLALEITLGKTNNYDRAIRIQQYLRENFGYTLDLPAERERDPIAQFLFETRRGHCEYFASSMALLLRTLGIPSRLVNGFQTGEYNPVGKDYIVREADAHSWVEAFFPGYGWVTFDPTPSTNPVHHSVAWVAISHYLDALELFWINWIVGYDSIRQITLFQDLQRDSVSAKRWAERMWATGTGGLSQFLRMTFFSSQSSRIPFRPFARLTHGLLWTSGGLAFIGALIGLFYALRHRRQMRSPQPYLVTEVFSQWLRALARRGFVRRPFQTPMEFSRSIADPRLRIAAVEITEFYNILRFRPVSLDSETFQAFREKLQVALQKL